MVIAKETPNKFNEQGVATKCTLKCPLNCSNRWRHVPIPPLASCHACFPHPPLSSISELDYFSLSPLRSRLLARLSLTLHKLCIYSYTARPDADEREATDRAAESPRPVLASAPSVRPFVRVRVRPGIRSLDACVAHYASENTFPLRIRHRPPLLLLLLLLLLVVVVVSVSYLRNRRSPFRAKFEIGNKFGGADGLHATVSLVQFDYIFAFRFPPTFT